MTIFCPLSTFPGFPIRDVTDQRKFSRFLFSWTPKTIRSLKMYNFMGMWSKLEELLNFEVTATLRHTNNKRRKGKRNNIWLEVIYSTRSGWALKNTWLQTDRLRDWVTEWLDWLDRLQRIERHNCQLIEYAVQLRYCSVSYEKLFDFYDKYSSSCYFKLSWACLGKFGHAHRHNSTIIVLPLWYYIIIQKIVPNGQTVLEIFKFEKSSNLIGREHLAWASMGMRTGIIASSVYSPYGITSSYKKSFRMAKRFWRYSNLKNRAIWLAESILGHNSRTRFFPDMRFAQKNQKNYTSLF